MQHLLGLFSVPEWLVAHVRLSFLSSAALPVTDPETLFRDLTDHDPELDEKRAQLKLRRRAIALDDHRIELSEAPNRLDYTRLGKLNLEVAGIQDLQYGRLCALEELADYTGIGRRIFSRVSNVTRVALGGLLFCRTSDPAEAYSILQTCLPSIDLDYARSSDFTMQINRPRKLENLDGLTLNRLGTWAAVSAVSVTQDGTKMTGENWAQVFFDVNTAVENENKIDEMTYNVLLDEMVKATNEIARGFTENGL